MKLDTFIICDMVRQENTGKHILIGVYDESIILNVKRKEAISITDKKSGSISLAYLLKITFFIRCSIVSGFSPDQFLFEISYDIPNAGEPKFGGEILPNQKGKSFNIALEASPGIFVPEIAKRMDFKLSFNQGEHSVELDPKSVNLAVNVLE